MLRHAYIAAAKVVWFLIAPSSLFALYALMRLPGSLFPAY
ncbi:MAG: hypothetical protein JWM57_3064 [Phycisphaerales bacterium]|nr:hypothetical protein [Phycisphaerales bacterium]